MPAPLRSATRPRRGPAPQSTVPPAAPGVEDAATLLRQFRMVFGAVRAHFQAVERQTGLGGAQVWALSEIARRPGLGVNDLARALDVQQPTASNLVRVLVKEGLVRSERSALDRRMVQLTAEPDGLAVLKRVPMPFSGVLPDALARLPVEVLRRMTQDMDRLIEELGADPTSAQKPLASL